MSERTVLRLTPPPTQTAKEGWIEAFDNDFWPSYPRKVGKFDARKAWLKVKPWTPARLEEVCAGLDLWVAYWREAETDKQFIPHAATWLNKHRWEDEPE